MTNHTRPYPGRGVSMTSATTGCIVGAGSYYTENEGGKICVTSDGKAWNKVANPDVYNNYKLSPRPLNDVTMLDAANGWAVGGWGCILHTEDSGANWSIQGNGLTNSSLYRVWFSAPDNGYAAGASAFLKYTTPAATSVGKSSPWAEPWLEKAARYNLIPDCLKGMDMTQPITRAEFAALSVKLYEALSGQAATPAQNSPFTDTTDPRNTKGCKNRHNKRNLAYHVFSQGPYHPGADGDDADTCI